MATFEKLLGAQANYPIRGEAAVSPYNYFRGFEHDSLSCAGSIPLSQLEFAEHSRDQRCYMSEKDLVFRVARALSPDAPNAALPRAVGCSKAAARAYTRGAKEATTRSVWQIACRIG
jgi:hypothetical protein